MDETLLTLAGFIIGLVISGLWGVSRIVARLDRCNEMIGAIGMMLNTILRIKLNKNMKVSLEDLMKDIGKSIEDMEEKEKEKPTTTNRPN